MKKTVTLLLVCIMICSIILTSCEDTTIQAQDLMSGITPNDISSSTSNPEASNPDNNQTENPNETSETPMPYDGEFSQMNLAVELFKRMNKSSEGENVLISPLSIQLALAMTANGAKGQTLAEMESLLGGDMDINELNAYLKAYTDSLPTGEKYKLNIANSIWFRDEEDRLAVNKDFLQTNADFYGAQIYKADFNDAKTVDDINNWVNLQTDGMIENIIDRIPQDTVMYLINALCFDAEWQKQYDLTDIYKGDFKNINSDYKRVDMMRSEENRYIETENAKGFLKYYADKKYAFVALLPNENDINGYVQSLTGDYLENALNNVQSQSGIAKMPKFSYEYELSINSVLEGMGMPTAFNGAKADFTDMATSSNGNIYIGDVLHKTFIQVDELGTKAGAVTKVEMTEECAPLYEWEITLDRPFVYMIIDCENNLPFFIGTLTDIE